VILSLVAIGESRAQAQGAGVDSGSTEAEIQSPVAAASDHGAFLPLTLAAAVPTRNSVAFGIGGYDGARRAGIGELAAEVRVWGPISLRGGAVYSDTKGRLRPSIGARLQIFSQDRAGIDGAVGVFYRPEGLTEPEGEIETVVSVGRRIGSLLLLGTSRATSATASSVWQR
jgi:hypothetical protein